jgi:hypothetical protein
METEIGNLRLALRSGSSRHFGPLPGQATTSLNFGTQARSSGCERTRSPPSSAACRFIGESMRHKKRWPEGRFGQ